MNDETLTAPDDSPEATEPQQEERALLTQSQFTREQQLDQDAALASLDETSMLPSMEPGETSFFPGAQPGEPSSSPNDVPSEHGEGPSGTRLSAPAAAYAQPYSQPYAPEPAKAPRRTWSKMATIAAAAAGIALVATMAGKAQTPRSSNVGLLGVRPEPEPTAEAQSEDVSNQEDVEPTESEPESVTYVETESEPEPEPEQDLEPEEHRHSYPGAGVGTITINYGPFSSPTGSHDTGYEDDTYDERPYSDDRDSSNWQYTAPDSRTTTDDDLHSTNDYTPKYTFDDEKFTYYFDDGTYITLDYDDVERFLNSYDPWDYDDRGSTYYNYNNYGGY